MNIRELIKHLSLFNPETQVILVIDAEDGSMIYYDLETVEHWDESALNPDFCVLGNGKELPA